MSKEISVETWKKFDNYCGETDYKDMNAKKITKILGGSIKVPKNVTDEKIFDTFYDEVKALKPKGERLAFGGTVINFKGDTTPLNKIFSEENVGSMQKKLWAHINSKGLKKGGKAATSTKAKTTKAKPVDDEEDEEDE